MRKLSFAALLFVAGPVAAQDGSLTAQDYIEIEELNARYAVAIDQCSNGGYDYADLYTPDGTFAVSEEWGGPGRVYATGRDELAVAAGGGPEGCRDPEHCSATVSITLSLIRSSSRGPMALGAGTSLLPCRSAATR